VQEGADARHDAGTVHAGHDESADGVHG
jgi:hypothetical protein